jgi:hypothetical protein
MAQYFSDEGAEGTVTLVGRRMQAHVAWGV